MKAGKYSIEVTGYLNSRPNVRASLSITLNVKQQSNSNDKHIILETVTLEVAAGLEIPRIFVSRDFREVTKNPYSILILDPTMNFVKFLQIAQ